MGVGLPSGNKARIDSESSTIDGDNESTEIEKPAPRNPSVLDFIFDRPQTRQDLEEMTARRPVADSAERNWSVFEFVSDRLRQPAKTRRKTAVKEDDLIRV